VGGNPVDQSTLDAGVVVVLSFNIDFDSIDPNRVARDVVQRLADRGINMTNVVRILVYRGSVVVAVETSSPNAAAAVSTLAISGAITVNNAGGTPVTGSVVSGNGVTPATNGGSGDSSSSTVIIAVVVVVVVIIIIIVAIAVVVSQRRKRERRIFLATREIGDDTPNPTFGRPENAGTADTTTTTAAATTVTVGRRAASGDRERAVSHGKRPAEYQTATSGDYEDVAESPTASTRVANRRPSRTDEYFDAIGGATYAVGDATYEQPSNYGSGRAPNDVQYDEPSSITAGLPLDAEYEAVQQGGPSRAHSFEEPSETVTTGAAQTDSGHAHTQV